MTVDAPSHRCSTRRCEPGKAFSLGCPNSPVENGSRHYRSGAHLPFDPEGCLVAASIQGQCYPCCSSTPMQPAEVNVHSCVVFFFLSSHRYLSCAAIRTTCLNAAVASGYSQARKGGSLPGANGQPLHLVQYQYFSSAPSFAAVDKLRGPAWTQNKTPFLNQTKNLNVVVHERLQQHCFPCRMDDLAAVKRSPVHRLFLVSRAMSLLESCKRMMPPYV